VRLVRDCIRKLSLVTAAAIVSCLPGTVLGQSFDAALGAYANGLYRDAATIWEALADGGDPASQYNLGLLYEQGLGVEQRPDVAAFWYRAAARQGYALAQFNLGGLYYRGAGVPYDPGETHDWWLKAARNGLAEAQYNLGLLLIEGRDVAADETAARVWLEQAANQGHAPSLELLDSIGTRYPQVSAAPLLESGPRPAPVPETEARQLAEWQPMPTLLGLEWVTSRDPDHYTLQVYQGRERAAALSFADAFGLADGAAIIEDSSGRHLLLVGEFADQQTALNTLSALPPPLRRRHPTVRDFGSIRRDVNETRRDTIFD
jgi:TPR repeat protein